MKSERVGASNRNRWAHYPGLRTPEELPPNLADLQVVASAIWENFRIVRLENGTILVKDGEATLPQALPVLRQIARDINVDALNPMGNPKNTRTLGADIIKALG